MRAFFIAVSKVIQILVHTDYSRHNLSMISENIQHDIK
jgi:hypothetical protein